MEPTSVAGKRIAACAAPVAADAERSPETAQSVISVYEDEVPPFVAAEMELLYENIFSSVVKVTLDGNKKVSAYVVHKDGKVVTVFLFRRKKGLVEVLNEVMAIDDDDICRFADTIFSSYATATVISFHAVRSAIRMLPYRYQSFNCLEDIVLTLPATPQDYFSSLGKNMRASITRYTKKLEKNFPSFSYQVDTKADVSEQDVRDIIRLSSARMRVKNQVSLHDETKTAQLIQLVKMHGLLAVARIDGRVCAGVICSRFGANYFMHVIAHDPQYDEFRLGKLCCYRSICECIKRGGKEFHFLWGRYEYKYRLLGVQRELEHVAVYRSGAQLLLNCNMVFKNAFKGYGRQLKRWVLDPRRARTFIARLANWFLNRRSH